MEVKVEVEVEVEVVAAEEVVVEEAEVVAAVAAVEVEVEVVAVEEAAADRRHPRTGETPVRHRRTVARWPTGRRRPRRVREGPRPNCRATRRPQ